MNKLPTCDNQDCHRTNIFQKQTKFVPCPKCGLGTYCSLECCNNDEEHLKECQDIRLNITNTQINSSMNETLRQIQLKNRTLDDYDFVPGDKGNLGRGAYGEVKLATDLHLDKLVAVKMVNKHKLLKQCNLKQLKNEIKLQRSLNHPHIIQLFHAFEDKENIYFSLEFAENGSLYKYIKKQKKLSEQEAFVFFFQTCIAVDYLHKKGIIHRDLKPENILLDEQGNVKLCDFGWSAESVETRGTFCGTLDYMAPEMLNHKPHDHRVDIWALGIFLFELLHGYAPFSKSNKKDQIVQSFAKPVQCNQNLSSDLSHLVNAILKVDYQQRISLASIFSHKWMMKQSAQFGIEIDEFIYQPSQAKSQNQSLSQSNIINQSKLDNSRIEQSRIDNSRVEQSVLEKSRREDKLHNSREQQYTPSQSKYEQSIIKGTNNQSVIEKKMQQFQYQINQSVIKEQDSELSLSKRSDTKKLTFSKHREDSINDDYDNPFKLENSHNKQSNKEVLVNHVENPIKIGHQSPCFNKYDNYLDDEETDPKKFSFGSLSNSRNDNQQLPDSQQLQVQPFLKQNQQESGQDNDDNTIVHRFVKGQDWQEFLSQSQKQTVPLDYDRNPTVQISHKPSIVEVEEEESRYTKKSIADPRYDIQQYVSNQDEYDNKPKVKENKAVSEVQLTGYQPDKPSSKVMQKTQQLQNKPKHQVAQQSSKQESKVKSRRQSKESKFSQQSKTPSKSSQSSQLTRKKKSVSEHQIDYRNFNLKDLPRAERERLQEIQDSTNKLSKRTKQLQSILDESEEYKPRRSRISMNGRERQNEDLGFFGKIGLAFGCVNKR